MSANRTGLQVSSISTPATKTCPLTPTIQNHSLGIPSRWQAGIRRIVRNGVGLILHYYLAYSSTGDTVADLLPIGANRNEEANSGRGVYGGSSEEEKREQ
jgi:hypothetical protein